MNSCGGIFGEHEGGGSVQHCVEKKEERMVVCHGTGVGRGIVFGRLHIWRQAQAPEQKGEGRNPKQEERRFQEACEKAREELSALEQKTRAELGEAATMVFATHQLLLEDPLFAGEVQRLIEQEQGTATWAVQQAGERLASQLEALDLEEWRARAADLRDVAGRVLRILQRSSQEGGPLPEEPCILAAEDLAPSDTVQFDSGKILGFAVAQGSLYCHTAILARSRNIPAVVALDRHPEPAWEGLWAALDAEEGCLYLEPTEEQLARLRQRQKAEEKRNQELRHLREAASVTRDGQRVFVCANVGNRQDLEMAVAQGAEGIGLFRTEFLFLEADHWPTEEEQFAVYRRAAEAMAGKRVVIRTLDIGADKQLPYFAFPPEANPALGCRGIRFCLAHPEVFRTQLRAIYRASAYGRTAILYPMISGVEELRRVLAFSVQVRRELAEQGIPTGIVEQGIMVETPAAALLGERLSGMVEFFSIGTNDLAQYTLAADRQNGQMAPYLEGCHPAVWRLVEAAAVWALQAGIRTGVCGDWAGDPAFTKALLSLGVRELSVAPSQILEVRRQIRETDLT